MKEITVWQRLSKEGNWEHNHITDGHSTDVKPTPSNKTQKSAWNGQTWRADHAMLDKDLKIVYTSNNQTG